MINKIEVYTKSRNVYAEKDVLGISGENDVETLEFVLDSAVEGEAYIELEKLDTSGEKQRYFIKLDKKDDSYVLKVKSSLLDVIQDIKMQLVIRQGDNQVFKSKEFEMQVLTAINATSTIPEQYPTWLEQLEQKVQEIDDKLAETTQLEELLTRSETARQEQEELRVEAEEIREKNIAKAIENIQDLKDEYDRNAKAKLEEYNNNSLDKISEFNENITKKTEIFDERVAEATEMFNNNSAEKLQEFNSNANTKKTDFNNNVTELEKSIKSDFDKYKTEKENELDTYTDTKKTDIDNYVTNTSKTALDKYEKEKETELEKAKNTAISEFDAHVEQLQTENNELSSNMPWNTTSGKFLHITDSAKYSKNKLEISGDLEQENRSGKNKFKIPESATGYDVTLTKNEDGTFNLSGTATGNASFLAFVDLDKSGIKNGASYIFHFTKNLQAGVEFRVEMYNGTNWLRAIAPNINSTTSTSTGTANATNATKVRFGIFVTSGTTVNIQNLGVQLEEGTTATEFEKYGATPSTKFPSMPVVCTGVQKIRQFGENWFNKNNISKINAVFGTSSIIANSSGKSFYIKIEPDTYTISRKAVGSRFVVGTTANIPKIGETIIERRVSSGSSITLTTSKNANYLVVYYLYNSSENEQEILDSIQIERGFKATEYKSYIEEINTLDLKNTELCAIKDTNGNVVAQDRALYRNGKWQWEKNIKKMVLNGTEAWKNATVGTVNHFRGQLYITESKTRNALCDKFVCRTSEAHGEWNYVLFEKDSVYINIANAELSEATLKGFKTWLFSNNVTVYYVLATPEYIDCTAEQSTVLDKLYNNFALQKGTNNIIVESENGVGVNMKLTYMQDLQTRLNILEAMCISNASQEV
ncbi:MAG TPA: hypothetical protein OIM35_08235 [Clostridiaceae bacterium]|nr:hypothetical protein [Clostridiaceae bacterium]